MSRTNGNDADVLVVGAGPTGLMLALQLVRHGVRVRLIERLAEPARATRALVVQARTLEIYAHLGLVEQALALGRRAAGANIWLNGAHAARLPLGDIGAGLSPYPFLLILGQDDNERLLREALAAHGVNVEWNTELLALTQVADRVDTTLAHVDGSTVTASFAWVAGCDGARSAVRELSGIAFPGAPYEQVFFIADTQATGPMTPAEMNVYLKRAGFHLFFPMAGRDQWRVVGIVPAKLRARQDLRFDDIALAVRAEVGDALVFQACHWFSTYRIHHRRAARFREQRCFLLGDAAHVHSPVGAQGMNTGLQDAYNLAWKLALVIVHGADPALLDSYAAERIPIADRLLNTTDQAFSAIVSTSRWAALVRTRLLPKLVSLAMRWTVVRRFAFCTVSQIGINYRRGPLSKNLNRLPARGPRAGDRFPFLRLEMSAGVVSDIFSHLDDTGFTLIIIGHAASACAPLPVWPNSLRTLVVADRPKNGDALTRAGMPSRGFYLLRPDGHVGLCGIDYNFTAITDYAAKHLHLCFRSEA